MCLSEPQTAVAKTRSRTSACPGWGTGTSLTTVALGPGPALVLTTAVIVVGRCPLGRTPEVLGRVCVVSELRGPFARVLNSQFSIRNSQLFLSISRLVVADVAGAGSGGRALLREDVDRGNVARDDLACSGDRELLEEKSKLLLERSSDC